MVVDATDLGNFARNTSKGPGGFRHHHGPHGPHGHWHRH